MHAVPELLAGLLHGLEDATCVRCSRPFKFPRRPDGGVPADCGPCAEAIRRESEQQAFAEALTLNLDGWVNKWLKAAGVSDRERTANPGRVPPALMHRIMAEAPAAVSLMRSGDLPAAGFGLSGVVGRGKTFALVCLFKEMLRARWLARVAVEGREVVKPWLAWRRWPEVASELRVLAADMNSGHADAERAMRKLASVEALVLDDLGSERMRGEGYEDDWVASLLDLLIDRRHNAMLPTWYTTNLTRQEFIDRYGARMFSRLCSENKLIAVPAGADMRIIDNARSG
jgi:hypothetical protein